MRKREEKGEKNRGSNRKTTTKKHTHKKNKSVRIDFSMVTPAP